MLYDGLAVLVAIIAALVLVWAFKTLFHRSGLIETIPDGVYHNYCMLGTILFTLYFIAVAAMFGYMIQKDFFDND